MKYVKTKIALLDGTCTNCPRKVTRPAALRSSRAQAGHCRRLVMSARRQEPLNVHLGFNSDRVSRTT